MRKNLLFSASMILILMIYSSLGSIKAQVQTFTKQIASSLDDVEEVKEGDFDPGELFMSNSSDIELDKDLDYGVQWVALRFTEVTIPKNATITEAKIQFTSKYVSSGACSVTFKIENSDNSAPFVADVAIRQISTRTTTADGVPWNVPDWLNIDEAGASELSPDLKILVQAVVNRAGWASGNAVCFIIDGPGTGSRGSRSYDYDPAKSAKLTVKYTTTVGIPETFVSAVKMYPNPVTDQLTVQGLENVKNLVIMDITGKTRQKVNVTGNEATVNMSELPKGMYLLKTGNKTLRFIKK